MKSLAFVIPLSVILLVSLVAVVGTFLPVSWGNLSYKPAQTVTVVGASTEQQENNEASFSVGVSQYAVEKETAVNQVNESIEQIIAAVKEFGIPAEDIKTENLSINRFDDPYRPDVSGQWQANNTISIVLRDAARANELADLLSRSGATNVYGPNFRVSDQEKSDEALLQSAIDDARRKAKILAEKSGGQLGRVLVIDETLSGGGPIYPMMDRGGGGGAALETGSTTVSKSVQVTFELK